MNVANTRDRSGQQKAETNHVRNYQRLAIEANMYQSLAMHAKATEWLCQQIHNHWSRRPISRPSHACKYLNQSMLPEMGCLYQQLPKTGHVGNPVGNYL